jgi:hypothetical protein
VEFKIPQRSGNSAARQSGGLGESSATLAVEAALRFSNPRRQTFSSLTFSIVGIVPP